MKCRLLSKPLPQRTQQHGGSEKYVQKIYHQLSHGIKNIHRSKLYRWEDFVAAAIFSGL